MLKISIKEKHIGYSEYLRDGEGNILIFKSAETASEYLKNKGLGSDDIKHLIFEYFDI